MKNVLIRTYYPHFHAALKYGHYFGSKSKIPIKDYHISMHPKPESSTDIDEIMTITLKSPPVFPHQESRKRGRRSKHKIIINKPLPIAFTSRRVSEEIPDVAIKEPIVVTPPPLTEKQINTNNRKRKTSITIHTNTNERNTKRFISSPSPEFSNEYQDIPYSDR